MVESLPDNMTFLFGILILNIVIFCVMGARCSSVVECLLMVQWVFGSISHGEPIGLFLIPANAPKWCDKWYVLSCLA